MTYEFIDTTKNDTVMVISTETAEPSPSLTLRVQPWLKAAIGGICLTQGLRFLSTPDSIGKLVGLVLLISIPSCAYFGWRDYQALKRAQEGRAARLARELSEFGD